MLVIFYLSFFALFWPLSPLKSPALSSPLIPHLGSFYSHLDLWLITMSCLKIWHIHKNGQKTGLTRSHITPTGAAQSWKLIPESSCCTGFMLMLMWKEVWGSAEHWHFLCPVCITAQCCGFAPLCNNTIYSRSREGKILQTDLLQ